MKKKLFVLVLFVLTGFSTNAQSEKKANLRIKVANVKIDSLVIMSYKKPTFKKVLKKDFEGIFRDTLSVEAGKYYINSLSKFLPNGIFLSNNSDLKITIDYIQADAKSDFSGKGANENEFVSQFSKNEDNFDYESMLQLSNVEFEKKISQMRLNLLNELDKKKYGSDFVIYITDYLDYFIKLKKETYKTIVEARE